MSGILSGTPLVTRNRDNILAPTTLLDMCVFCDTTLETVAGDIPGFVLRPRGIRGTRGHAPGISYLENQGRRTIVSVNWSSSAAHRVLVCDAIVGAWISLTNELVYFSALTRALKVVREGCTALPIAPEHETAVRDAAGQTAADRERVHALVCALGEVEEDAATATDLTPHTAALDTAYLVRHAGLRPRGPAVATIEETLTTYAFFKRPVLLQLAPTPAEIHAHVTVAPGSSPSKIEPCFDRVTVPPDSPEAARVHSLCPDVAVAVVRTTDDDDENQPPGYSTF